MEYQGISHLVLVTNDMEKTVRFYRGVLGMRVVATLAGEVGGQRMRHYFLSLGPGSCLAFFEWPDVELPPRKDSGVPASGRQFDHVSIGVNTEATLVRLQQRAREAGVPASDVVDHGVVRSIYFEDPTASRWSFPYGLGIWNGTRCLPMMTQSPPSGKPSRKVLHPKSWT